MKTLGFLAALALATTAPAVVRAEPRNMSQNPRVGLLAELSFGAGETRLPDAAGSQLGRVAAWAEENFDGLVVLDGHADRHGPNADNVRLALARARLVRDHLVGLGVDPDQIIISAFGAEKHRARARVAIWGTHNSREQVIGLRQKAHAIFDGNVAPQHAPTLMGSR
jgi:outer membrane protein OmpA-like peptidoglycan-associated protein